MENIAEKMTQRKSIQEVSNVCQDMIVFTVAQVYRFLRNEIGNDRR